jgi:hypothetical protein
MRTSLPRLLPFLALVTTLAGCGSESESTTGTTTTTTTTPGLEPLDIPDDPDCDPLVPEVCAMPFPSSRWLAPDSKRVTGYTLTFGATTLPQNKKGVHVDPEPYKRLDGFGVGVPAVAFFPELDGSDLPDETRIAESLSKDARVMMFEVDGKALKRIPCFAEIDKAAKLDEERSIIVRPAVILKEATRYVVALRGLKRQGGSDVKPSDAFIALRDHRAAGTPVEDRVPHFEEIFGLLGDAGVPREDLLLSWDWVTASGEALHGPLLHMRDEAFAELGDASPVFAITSMQTYTEAENPNIAYEVLGTFEVPDYTVKTKLGPADAYLLNWGADGLPAQTGTYKAEFRARIPRSAAGGEPHGVMMHGHGLNGSHGQIAGEHFDLLANQEKVVIVGCNMLGMSSEDVNTILEMLNDLSGFPFLADRLHQGVLDHAFLIRGMKKGFDKIPEIAATGLVIDPAQMYYNGISQGGIFGATHMAMSLDITRGHLGVPGNNYSTLLQRSSDFAPFFVLLGFVYPDARDEQVLLGAIQNLWDRTDPVSHYRHISAEPYPGTPSHDVLLASATGDWQVANLTNEIAARSDIGIALLPGYGKDVALVDPTPYPHNGSGIVTYNFGNPWAPPGNKPPFDDIGDPHGKPRQLPWHNEQMFHFYRTGEIIDVCGGDGCNPD